ncbi:MAG: hydroxymethylbilane synthase [Bacteroidales bacterium]|nr:hydroxymethylbilane synthase [Bacteroidales bacterium]
MPTLIIGTRGSKLALYQAEAVKKAFEKELPEIDFEIKVIDTKGDKVLDKPLSQIGDKGIFTAEIEKELLDGTIDFAVHSLKDLPSELPNNLRVSAVLPRAEFRDCLVSKNAKSLSELTENEIIATSSLRRRAQLLHFNPKLNVVDIRGNVNTRLQKFDDNYCTSMIMASAGLQRLGFDNRISAILNEDEFIPAACQGVIAIETCSQNSDAEYVTRFINDIDTWNASFAERLFLKMVDGGCKTPFGCYTKMTKTEFFIKAFISMPDGSNYIVHQDTQSADNAHLAAYNTAKYLLNNGGKEILQELRIVSNNNL